ncbi:MAG: hypothetical protein U5R48_08490 [Gammaproteobacteria bacterium]|nr:hypothetical protein [Gammaproteobacteria bacterium]
MNTTKPKGAFKTGLKHRTLRSILGGDGRRQPGHRPRPVLVRMDPEPGRAASDKPPVRIFLGTEPAQYRAERVFVWSIAQVRDPSRIYEIYLMKDLEGFDRSGWKTGFTNYRYAIPALAGARGRAIYNDVDQIYLADPAELFDADMGDAGVLSIDDKETSVMLIDCERMAPLWTLEDARHLQKHKHYRRLAHDAGLWGHMDPAWNHRDSEYREGVSRLPALHHPAHPALATVPPSAQVPGACAGRAVAGHGKCSPTRRVSRCSRRTIRASATVNCSTCTPPCTRRAGPRPATAPRRRFPESPSGNTSNPSPG